MAIWSPSHLCHTAITRVPTPYMLALAEKTQCAAPAAEYNLCTPPYLFGGISLQCPDCLQNEGECSKWRAERIDKIYHTFLSIQVDRSLVSLVH